MKPRVSFYTFGCRLNQSETAVIRRTFETDHYHVVDIHDTADIVVINTCTVTENGDADTLRLVNRISRLNPSAEIALVGCQAQVQKNRLANLPNVRWVVGNARKMDLKSIVKEHAQEARTRVLTPTIDRKPFTIPWAGIDKGRTRANLKIQDGCDFFCSFCEIPYARGRARSREFKDILNEARALVAGGHKELVLTGINIGTYANSGSTLLDVINALENIAGLERVRVSSIEPTTIPDELITKMAQSKKLCRHLHIPLQSASDTILKAMKRTYTYNEFVAFIQNVKERVPQVCIGTDIIVGFPGETEKKFEQAVARLKDLPIDYIHVFSYSIREHAKSKHLDQAVSPEQIKTRSRAIRQLSHRKRGMFYQSLLNTRQALLTEASKTKSGVGLTDNYVRVYLEKPSPANKMFTVSLNGFHKDGMTGTLVAPQKLKV